MKRLFSLALALLLLTGCALPAAESTPTIYEASFLELFDTLTVVKGAAESQEAFEEISRTVHDELKYYHQLFDVYNSYENLNNLKTVNDRAGQEPVVVDEAIIALLKDCSSYYELTGGKVNVAMGAVLKLWHDARTAGIEDPLHAALPDMAKLQAAAAHSDFSCVVIDEAASTVFITDPKIQLDVGAVAKGWAAQRVAEMMPANMLLSVGGNVCATGPKTADTPWVIGVQNPAGGDPQYLHTLYVTGGSYVTSGDYQRAYTVDGKSYHHIIDPETLMPSAYWRSVTVVCHDSGLADALSTALFLMPREAGQALLESCGAMALWVDGAGNEYFSPGFEEIIRT